MSEQPKNKNEKKAASKKAKEELKEQLKKQIQNEKEDQDKDKGKDEKEDKQKWFVIGSIVAAVIIMLLLLILLQQCYSEPNVLNPDYPPEADDPNAETMAPSNDEKLEHEEGGGAVSIMLYDDVTIDISDRRAFLYFANPYRSTQDMMLQLVIQDEVIVQTGRLRPGYQLKQAELLKDTEKLLREGTYEGKIVIYYYDVENNEKAVVNTEVDVKIKVEP